MAFSTAVLWHTSHGHSRRSYRQEPVRRGWLQLGALVHRITPVPEGLKLTGFRPCTSRGLRFAPLPTFLTSLLLASATRLYILFNRSRGVWHGSGSASCCMYQQQLELEPCRSRQVCWANGFANGKRAERMPLPGGGAAWTAWRRRRLG